jgi:transcriptional regulator GlxA family with amidase domain
MGMTERELLHGPKWLATVLEYIEAHVHERIRVTDLAALAKVHPVYFARVFKASAGVSVLRYIRQRRVFAASIAMNAKSIRLADVANEFGFADQAHFSRVFRQELGASPSKFVASKAVDKRLIA